MDHEHVAEREGEKREKREARSERGLVSLEQESTLFANKLGQKKRPKIKQHSTKI